MALGMSTTAHVRARTVAGLWASDYVPLVQTGAITEQMRTRAESDLRRLKDATDLVRDGASGTAPAIGWSVQGQLQLLVDYLRREGVRDDVPGWQDNFPSDLRFLVDVLEPPDGARRDTVPQEIVPPKEVVDRLGAERAVELIARFYQLMLSQPELAVYFDGSRTAGVPVDVESLREHFLAFLVAAFTGAREYRGQPLPQALRGAHKRLAITDEHWRMTIGIFTTAMRLVEPPVPESTIRAVVTGIAPYHDDVVGDGELGRG
jgi:truncated hemoglobin YjbI